MSKSRSIIPNGGNDVVMTPQYLTDKIINYFDIRGKCLEPCRGTGNFYTSMVSRGLDVDWCEISDGRNFFDYKNQVDWIITNPPFSQFRSFLKHSMEISNNVVFLSLINAFFMKARLRDIKDAGFGFKSIISVDTPPKPWPQFGIQLGFVHLCRDFSGETKIEL